MRLRNQKRSFCRLDELLNSQIVIRTPTDGHSRSIITSSTFFYQRVQAIWSLEINFCQAIHHLCTKGYQQMSTRKPEMHGTRSILITSWNAFSWVCKKSKKRNQNEASKLNLSFSWKVIIARQNIMSHVCKQTKITDRRAYASGG